MVSCRNSSIIRSGTYCKRSCSFLQRGHTIILPRINLRFGFVFCLSTKHRIQINIPISYGKSYLISVIAHSSQLCYTEKMKTDQDIAWAAGLFEGEGCITTGGRPDRWQLLLTSNDFDVIEKFSEIVEVGTNSIVRRKIYEDGLRWQCSRRIDVLCVLTDFLPWLGNRRTLRAMEAIESLGKTLGLLPLSSIQHTPSNMDHKERVSSMQKSSRSLAMDRFYENQKNRDW